MTVAFAAALLVPLIGSGVSPVSANQQPSGEVAWISSPESNSVVGGQVTVRVQHRCPLPIIEAVLFVSNGTFANSYYVPVKSLDPVVFEWDTPRTGLGTIAIRARLSGCTAALGVFVTKPRYVIVGPVAVPPPTTVPPTPSVPRVPDVSAPTVPAPPPTPSVVPPPPLAPGTGVRATVRIWHGGESNDGSGQLHASCAVEVLPGSGVAAVLDAAQATGCIRSWVPDIYGDRNNVLCIDGLCAALGDNTWPFLYDRWEHPRPLQVSGGETVDVRYQLRSVNSCSLWYACR
ncbi:MAG: hypothetical protein KY458_02115 [Actinobacteria bacterium]|nr:hypothetical protein [Actinomycetota bacterium]